MLPLIGLIIYFFFQFIRPQDWIWVSLIDAPLDYVIFAFIIISGAPKLFQSLSRLAQEPLFRFVICYFLIVCFSNIINWEIESLTIYSIIVFKLILVYVMVAAFVDTSVKRIIFVGCLVLFVMIIAYQGLYQVEHSIGWAGQPLNWRGSIQWIGSYDGSNSLCVLFNFAVPFLLAFTLGPWGIIGKLFGVIGGGLVLYSVYLTQSRGGAIALLVILSAFLWNKTKSKLIVIAIIGSIVIAVAAIGTSRISSGETGDESARARIKLWEEGLELIRYDSPLFGIGYGNFPNYTHRRLEPHNALVANMAELGLVGLFIWISMFYIFLKEILDLRRDKSMSVKEQSLLSALMVSLIGWMASAFFLTLRKSYLPYILFGLVSGYRFENKRTFSLESGDMIRIGLVEVAGVSLIWIVKRAYMVLNP